MMLVVVYQNPTCHHVHKTGVDCEDPGEVPAASRAPGRGHSIGCGDVITYFCNHGFEMKGRPSIRCLENGKFSGDPPQCLTSGEKGHLEIYGFQVRVVGRR